MARPRLPLGQFGKIARTEVSPGRWVARARFRDFDGATRKVEAWGESGAAAERRLRAALTDRSAPTGEDIRAESTIGTLLDVYIATLEADGRARRTIDHYRFTAEYVRRAIGGVQIREATTQRIERALRAIVDKHGPATGKMTRSLLGGAFKKAVQYGATASNPVRETSAVTVPTKASRALTADELAAVLRGVATSRAMLPPAAGAKRASKIAVADYCRDADLVDVVTILAATGCRISEALAIRWSDIDLTAKTITVSGHIVRAKGIGLIREDGSKTAAGSRTLPLPDFAVAMLLRRQVAAETNPHNVVFPSSVGTLRDVDNVSKQWRRVRAAIGFDWVTTHTFRRTVATLIDSAGLSARVGADQLGHRQVSMTQDRYMGRGSVHDEVADVLEEASGLK